MDIGAVLKSSISDFRSSESIVLRQGEIHLSDSGNKSSGTDAAELDIGKSIDTLNRAASAIDPRLSFSYDEKTKRIIMKVHDPSTNEVVRQIPSEEMIRLLENIHESIGLMIDTKR